MVSTTNLSSVHLSDYDNGSQPETSQEYAIPPDLFTVSDTTDKRVEADVMDPVLKNLFDKSKNAFTRFHINKLVNNPMLRENFDSYKRKLQMEGKNPQEVYGFIQLPNGDHGEEDELCAYGVRVGMNYRGELADASKGVYLSRFADTCTPCPFINDQCLRILICKVLLGKTRRVKPSADHTNSNAAPDPNYNSYLALTPDLLKPETSTPQERYLSSLIYVYEYTDKDTTSDRPASIFPLSIAEIQCNKPGIDLMNILVPRNNSSIIWTGTLQLQRYTLKHVTMHSHFTSVGRPRGMDNLNFKISVPYDTVVNCMPIMRLLESDMISALLQQQEVVFEDQQNPMYIQYFVLQSPDCEDFDNLCTLMRKFELVGVNKLPSGTHLFLIPNGGLSMKLGLCLFNAASFHCISVSIRPSNQANNNWQQDLFASKPIEPAQSSIINMSMIASRFRKIAPLPIASVAPVKNVVPPLNFNVPPPHFNVPPPKIQSPSVPKFFPAQPISTSRLSASSTGSNSRYESVGSPSLQRVLPQNPFARFSDTKIPPTAKKVNATPNQIDRVLNEVSKKTGTLDPRLAASNKGYDPRRSNVPHSPDNDVHGNNKFQLTTKESNNQFNSQSMPNHGQKYDSAKKAEEVKPAERSRRRSSSSDGQLEIVEDSTVFSKPPEDSLNSRKRSANFGNGEDIDLRSPIQPQFNGQQNFDTTLPPPKLINIPTTLNSSGSSSKQSRSSCFGVQMANIKSPPSLISPSKLKPKEYSTTPPSLFPPKYDSSRATSTIHDQIVIIFDPDLVVSPVLNPDQLRQIFLLAQTNNEKADNPKILFKWHACINEELRQQITDAPANSLLANRAQKIKNTLIEFVDLIDLVNPHLCDKGPRSVQKNLICAMNIKRMYENAQLVFLSAAVTSDSPQAPNFSSNDINLQSPEQLISMVRRL